MWAKRKEKSYQRNKTKSIHSAHTLARSRDSPQFFSSFLHKHKRNVLIRRKLCAWWMICVVHCLGSFIYLSFDSNIHLTTEGARIHEAAPRAFATDQAVILCIWAFFPSSSSRTIKRNKKTSNKLLFIITYSGCVYVRVRVCFCHALVGLYAVHKQYSLHIPMLCACAANICALDTVRAWHVTLSAQKEHFGVKKTTTTNTNTTQTHRDAYTSERNNNRQIIMILKMVKSIWSRTRVLYYTRQANEKEKYFL